MSDDLKLLDELEALEKKATKGPWGVRDDHPNRACLRVCPTAHDFSQESVADCYSAPGDRMVEDLSGKWIDDPERVANASLIPAARNALPLLLRLARRGLAAEEVQPDMWWDPHDSEECIHDPYDAIENNEYIKPGDTFRLDCAKRLPSRVYTVVADPSESDPNGISYRDATPEEVAEHEAHEKAEKARRKAEMDAENERRRQAALSRLAEKENL